MMEQFLKFTLNQNQNKPQVDQSDIGGGITVNDRIENNSNRMNQDIIGASRAQMGATGSGVTVKDKTGGLARGSGLLGDVSIGCSTGCTGGVITGVKYGRKAAAFHPLIGVLSGGVISGGMCAVACSSEILQSYKDFFEKQNPKGEKDPDPKGGKDPDPKGGKDPDPKGGKDPDPKGGKDPDPKGGKDPDPKGGKDPDPKGGKDPDPKGGTEPDPSCKKGADCDKKEDRSLIRTLNPDLPDFESGVPRPRRTRPNGGVGDPPQRRD